MALAAPWADEYNTIFAPPEICRKRRTTVAWERAGPDPDTLLFSLMTRCIVGEDCGGRAAPRPAVMALIGDSGPEDDWIARYREEWVVGTVDEVVDRLLELEDGGVGR